MSDVDVRDVHRRANRAHERLDEHDDVQETFDRRISRNENWRLQAQGALKFASIALGAGALGYLGTVLGIF